MNFFYHRKGPQLKALTTIELRNSAQRIPSYNPLCFILLYRLLHKELIYSFKQTAQFSDLVLIFNTLRIKIINSGQIPCYRAFLIANVLSFSKMRILDVLL